MTIPTPQSEDVPMPGDSAGFVPGTRERLRLCSHEELLAYGDAREAKGYERGRSAVWAVPAGLPTLADFGLNLPTPAEYGARIAQRYESRISALKEDFERARASEEVERDAERYRWLREQFWLSSPLAVVRDPKAAVKPGYDCPSLARLDAAIDAARLSRKGGTTPTGDTHE